MYVCMHTCIHAYINTYIHTYLCTSEAISLFCCLDLLKHVCVVVHFCIVCVCVCVRICMYLCMYLCMCMLVCVSTCDATHFCSACAYICKGAHMLISGACLHGCLHACICQRVIMLTQAIMLDSESNMYIKKYVCLLSCSRASLAIRICTRKHFYSIHVCKEV
jgi:nuclear pore complex protein Nup62